MKRILGIAVALAVPALLAAQTEQTPIPANEQHASETAKAKFIPSAHASDMARQKVAAAMARRATRVRGQAVGLDNRPVTPATRPALAQPGAGPGGRAIPATAATPASPSRKPSDPGAGHSRRP